MREPPPNPAGRTPPGTAMSVERFNHLAREGALHHPLVPFVISRLALALWSSPQP